MESYERRGEQYGDLERATRKGGRGMIVAVIPARYASTRFPGKLLAPLHGRAVLLHVLERARRIRGLDRILVATDDERIAAVAAQAGAEVEITSPHHASGSDRIGEVLSRLRPRPEFVINLQGDEPLLSRLAVEGLLFSLREEPDAIWTLAERVRDEEEFLRPSVVKVVRAQDGRALYFSRAPVPHVRSGGSQHAAVGGKTEPATSIRLRHVGVYAYPRVLLERFLAAGPSPLETAEGLEQLRALELGLTVRVRLGGWPDSAVDTPEDLARLHKRYPSPETLPEDPP